MVVICSGGACQEKKAQAGERPRHWGEESESPLKSSLRGRTCLEPRGLLDRPRTAENEPGGYLRYLSRGIFAWAGRPQGAKIFATNSRAAEFFFTTRHGRLPQPLLPLRGGVYPSPYPLPWTWTEGVAIGWRVLFRFLGGLFFDTPHRDRGPRGGDSHKGPPIF